MLFPKGSKKLGFIFSLLDTLLIKSESEHIIIPDMAKILKNKHLRDYSLEQCEVYSMWRVGLKSTLHHIKYVAPQLWLDSTKYFRGTLGQDLQLEKVET